MVLTTVRSVYKYNELDYKIAQIVTTIFCNVLCIVDLLDATNRQQP